MTGPRAHEGSVLQPESPFMTTAEVAHLLRRSPATVLAWSKAGHLRPTTQLPDGGYLWDRLEVEALARGGERPVRHATVDPGLVRSFVDQAYARSIGRKKA